ncbi:MAG: sigma-54 dependent transcriptional regulator [Cytophagales bacterium]|nr:sigma-54 dependent transcriptional regulator [Cytophagales bacterium]
MIKEIELQAIKQRFGIIGNSSQLNRSIEVAAMVAPTDLSVLITGESGSGKESFSKIIHHLSARKHGSFIAINCGAIPEGTIDSELFGHEKGSFTGAVDTRKGYFEVTSGGTIFLDEIGEMPLGTQARLLRVLENGEFIKVGSSKIQKTDVRVVAATNVNLLEAVEKGKFREDLYYRLNTVPLYVPPLRERGNDVYLLFVKFAADFADKYRTKPIYLAEKGKTALLNYRFPGNIRQLKNLVEQMSVLETQKVIDFDTLSKYLPTSQALIPLKHPQQTDNAGNAGDLEILYKIILDLKGELSELKKIVFNLLQNEDSNPVSGDEAEKLLGMFRNETGEQDQHVQKPTLLLSNPSDALKEGQMQEAYPLEHPVITIDTVNEVKNEDKLSESLSIEKHEQELIIRALKKNNNKRKHAARDLGISERTLYRKIKQYDIREED